MIDRSYEKSPISNPVISLDNISVCYRVQDEPIWSFKEYIIRFLQGKVHMHDFWALKKVSIVVQRGDCLGIIGPNGAGKSTLLKVIARVLHPTEGRVQLDGEVSPLLELGAGFHAELTGRENIFLNGTLLGYTRREVSEHLDCILNFAQIGTFIDAPLRTYSSGMVARLGFAVATAWQPEILILDEILAVGDQEFRAKCFQRIQDFCAKGTTILLATHDMISLQKLCNQAIWLDQGKIQRKGDVSNVVRAYLDGKKLPA